MQDKKFKKPFPILDSIESTSDLKKLSIEKLNILANEIREFTVETVLETGGHLGAGLGVVELTIALHYVFDTPRDKLIWDVGHQSYPHKILTGRKNRMSKLRQFKGLSGFTNRDESIFDPFGAGHSSTSISAGLGMCAIRDLKKENFEVISVIGDGAMSAGMAYEAMNNAYSVNSRIIVVLNDNKMSISPAVGGMSKYLLKLISSKPFLNLRETAKKLTSFLPSKIETLARKAEQYTKDLCIGGNLFEEMGFYYIGPINGHRIEDNIAVFKNIYNNKAIQRPILVHVVTEKGHGYEVAKQQKEKLHAVSKFSIKDNNTKTANNKKPLTYTSIFSNTLINIAKKDNLVVAITAAMTSGTGLEKFKELFPKNFFDVGIAEQHAVTFAAGIACEGYKPFCAIYSTFLQRAYDQIIHDVAIQCLPVRFAIDRAGYVGHDGATHSGSFDITYLASLPNFVIMAASDGIELARMIMTSYLIDDKPSAVRYPRGEAINTNFPKEILPLEIGKGRIIEEGNDIAILSLGTRLEEAKKASKILKKKNFSVTIADARFVKPLDKDLIRSLAKKHKALITIEEGSIGGFGAHVLDFLASEGLSEKIKIRTMKFPDKFLEQNTHTGNYEEANLMSKDISNLAIKLLS